MTTLSCTIHSRRTLQGLGGLSGIEQLGDHLYLIADDAPYLIKTNAAFEQIERIAVFAEQNWPLVPMHKAEKPDLEGLAVLRWQDRLQLLMVGSGSTEQRKSIRLFDPHTRHVSTLYQQQDYDFFEQYVAASAGHELNLEAVCANDQHVFIFQRGHLDRQHWVMQFDLAQFCQPTPLQAAWQRTFHLNPPDIAQCASGVSGACWLESAQLMLCCASVENSANSYDDGAVMGSMLGLVDASGHALGWVTLCDAQQQPLPIKVEGVVLQADHMAATQAAHTARVWLVTDSDGGDSEVLDVSLDWSHL